MQVHEHFKSRWRAYAGVGAVAHATWHEFGELIEKMERTEYLMGLLHFIGEQVVAVFFIPHLLWGVVTCGGLVFIWWDVRRLHRQGRKRPRRKVNKKPLIQN